MLGEAVLSVVSQPMWVFLTVLARVSPLLMLAPPTRSAAVPMRIRALLAIGAALLLSPIAFSTATSLPNSTLLMVLALAGEILLGILLGSIVLLAVTSLQIAGQAVGHLAGFDMAIAVDPGSSEEVPVVSNLLGLLAMVILLIMGGHRILLECCLDSFQRYPSGSVRFGADWWIELELVLRHTFVIGVRAAAPMATALLLANLMTGLLARTLPQLNILAIGFNINAMALLVLLFVSVGGVARLYQHELSTWLESCSRIASPDI